MWLVAGVFRTGNSLAGTRATAPLPYFCAARRPCGRLRLRFKYIPVGSDSASLPNKACQQAPLHGYPCDESAGCYAEDMTFSIQGECHCGNVRFELETETPLGEIVTRACDCRFCRLHGARTWSDPQGQARVFVRDPDELQTYTFGSKSTEFIICRTCGAYAGAAVTEGGETWCTLNMRLTGNRLEQQAVSYGTESRTQKMARRRLMWTPTEIRLSS